METFSDYINRKTAETQAQLKKQSAINADVAANALESAAIAAANTHAEATSGGMIDSNVQPETVTAARDMQAQQENLQPRTKGPTDEPYKVDMLIPNPDEKPQPSTEGPTGQTPLKPLPMPYVQNPSKDGAMKPLPGTVVENPSTEGALKNYGDDNARRIAIANDIIGQQGEAEPSHINPPDAELPLPAEKKEPEATDTPEQKEQTPDSEDNAHKDQIQLFSDLINEHKKEQERQEAEMKAQEKANTISTMATGATELAAGIINMLSVGELHASNQQYKNYSQDWMRKADQDNREHRARRRDMQATMDRLRAQQEQVRTAARLEDIRQRQQKAQAEQKASEEEYNRKLREQKIKDDRDADMLSRGFVPDENAPGSYRFDPDLAAQIAAAKKGSASASNNASGSNQSNSSSGGNTKSTQSTTKHKTGDQGGGRRIITVPTEEEWSGEGKQQQKKNISLADELRGL